MRKLTLIFAAGALCLPAAAQTKELDCRNQWGNSRQENFCEIREMTVPATGRLDIDGETNGGVTVKGWDRADVLVRAAVHTAADSQNEARALAGQVRIETVASRVRADGPKTSGHASWGVNYEVFVPQRIDLGLKAHNGGIHIADVRGDIGFSTTNGGVKLERLAGNVHGNTTNGGLNVTLAGDRWDGQGLDAQTTNGGVSLAMPANYSASFEAATTNGGIHVDFPVTVQGEIGRRFATTIGAGGPPIRVTTTNGGVHVKRI